MYVLNYSETFRKQIKKLPKDIQKRVIEVLERIKIRPFSYIKKLTRNPFFSLRAGDYRIILDIKQDKLIILVIEIGHRKKIYKH
jgi:mRNA interferase RelE/StbE